jgi:hypothetical protein
MELPEQHPECGQPAKFLVVHGVPLRVGRLPERDLASIQGAIPRVSTVDLISQDDVSSSPNVVARYEFLALDAASVSAMIVAVR